MDTDQNGPPGVAFGMTDLEERLRADGGQEVRAGILSRLAQLDGEIGAMVGHGLTRDGFRRAQSIQNAVAAARNYLTGRR